jgi:hypothetical protein
MQEQRDDMMDGLSIMARERAGCAFRDFKAAPAFPLGLAHLLSIKIELTATTALEGHRNTYHTNPCRPRAYDFSPPSGPHLRTSAIPSARACTLTETPPRPPSLHQFIMSQYVGKVHTATLENKIQKEQGD